MINEHRKSRSLRLDEDSWSTIVAVFLLSSRVELLRRPM